MNGLINFVSDSKFHDSLLISMVITSFIGAIHRIASPTKWWQTFWNFFYDWLTGFWSMKTGQKPVSDPIKPETPAKN